MVIEGPLAPLATGIAGQLEALGYAPSTAAGHMYLVGRLSRFLQQRGLLAGELSTEVVEEFFRDLHAHHGSSWPTPRTFRWLVGYLVDIGVMQPPPPAPPRSWEGEVVDRYRRYLLDERGLARKTVVARERTARLFLAERSGHEPHGLDAGHVSRFVTRQVGVLTVRSAERLVNGMRSFLRFACVVHAIRSPGPGFPITLTGGRGAADVGCGSPPEAHLLSVDASESGMSVTVSVESTASAALAAARLRESPLSSSRWAPWTRRSRMASATVGSPSASCQ